MPEHREKCSSIFVRRPLRIEEAQKRVDALATLLEDEFEDAIFATKGESMEQIVGYYLGMREKTLAVAESCTGGMLAERITSVSGSSRYFLGGAVVYDNSVKLPWPEYRLY